MKRYELSREYHHGIGMPEIIERADGRFVRWEDVQRLREALLWNAGALQACCSEGIREQSNITITSETKCFSEILDMADAALSQE